MADEHYEAVFEGDVFRPIGAVSLPQGTKVVISVQAQLNEVGEQNPVDAEVIKILSRRHNSGQADGAARHNEHQP